MRTLSDDLDAIGAGVNAAGRVAELAIDALNDVRTISDDQERNERIDRAYRDIAAILLEVLP